MHFIKKIFSPIVLTISSFLFIYTFYKSEIYWNGNIRDYYYFYYFISFLLIFFSIITFFIKQKIKEYLIIVTISLVFSIYLSEGYLTFKDKSSIQQLYEKKTGKKWDTRSRFQIYNDLKKKNNKIVLSVYPKEYIKNTNLSIFPLSGISNSETIHCNENGYYSIYQSDRYGFNNPDEEWDNKEIEYLLAGDSFTHGACVNRPNDISSVLRKLSNKSVLNLGFSGNGSLIEYASLREYLNSNVKKVLWIYFEGNDLKVLTKEKNNKILINYLNDLNFTQKIKSKQNEINILANNKIEEEKERESEREIFRKIENSFKFKFIRFIKIFKLRNFLYDIIMGPAPISIPEFKKIIELTKDLAIKNNSKLYFVYLPEYKRYKVEYDNTKYNLVKNIVNELKIPFIDINKEVFEKEKNPLKLWPFQKRGHYTVEGYKKIAEAIYKSTKD